MKGCNRVPLRCCGFHERFSSTKGWFLHACLAFPAAARRQQKPHLNVRLIEFPCYIHLPF